MMKFTVEIKLKDGHIFKQSFICTDLTDLLSLIETTFPDSHILSIIGGAL